MAQRLISAAIAIPVGILIVALDNEWLYYIAMAIFSAVAVYELLHVTGYVKNKTITAISILFTAFVPFAYWLPVFRDNNRLIYFGFVVVLLLVMIFKHEKLRFEQVALICLVSLAIPLALGSVAFIRTKFPEHSVFLIVYTIVSIWVGDGGAYFVGTLCGKHKMCPKISPKKTWEGFVGGLVTSGVISVAMCFIYEFIDTLNNNGAHTFVVNKPYLIILSVVLSGLAVVGDLSASLVKRECGVKDFGNFLPGHGGVLDRFDSVLVGAPCAYLIFQIFAPITPLV